MKLFALGASKNIGYFTTQCKSHQYQRHSTLLSILQTISLRATPSSFSCARQPSSTTMRRCSHTSSPTKPFSLKGMDSLNLTWPMPGTRQTRVALLTSSYRPLVHPSNSSSQRALSLLLPTSLPDACSTCSRLSQRAALARSRGWLQYPQPESPKPHTMRSQ